MASYYVYSGAGGAGTGADWANAYTSLVTAMTGKVAGDVFYVAHDHAQTQATAMTIVSPGTEATPCRVHCVNRAGSVPPVSADLMTTAQISTTVASNIALHGCVSVCYGIIFNAGSGTSTADITCSSIPSLSWKFVNCSLRLGGTSTASRITMGGTSPGNPVVLENTTVQFANVSQRLTSSTNFVWRNTPSAILAGVIPNELMGNGFAVSHMFLEGVDLSAMTSGKYLVRIDTLLGAVTLKDCKLGSSAILNGVPSVSSPGVFLIRCDSGDTNYRTEKHSFRGVQTTETTIVRTGGASDGTTPISWRIQTATSNREAPFESLPISIWNETVGSPVTVTIQGGWGQLSQPNNDDIWIECQYLGTSGFPLASKVTSGVADSLASGTAIPVGSGSWGGSGVSSTFSMSVTMTPQEKGPITIYVRGGLSNTTLYVDPKPEIT